MRTFFIHLLFFFVFINPCLSNKNSKVSKTLPTKLNGLITKPSFEQQVAQLLWINSLDTQINNFGGVVTNNAKAIINTNSYSILNVYDGVASTNTSIPFPSFDIRNKLSNQGYEFAQAIYKSDFIIDIAPSTNIAFYGIDIINSKPILTPHFQKDSLLVALSNYDQIWWFSTMSEAIKNLTKQKKPSKKLKKLVEKLAKKAAIQRQQLKTEKEGLSYSFNNDAYTRWAWKQYSSAILLLNNPKKLPIKTLDRALFCTTTLQNDKFHIFNRHLNFYINHSYLPNAIDSISSSHLDKIATYDNIIVPTHSLNKVQLANLNMLAKKSSVLLVWFSTKPIPLNLSNNITQIQVPELNGVTEALVPQLIFGALGFVSRESNILYAPPSFSTLPIGRLQFAPPALAYIDAKILQRIDTVVESGIRQQATPGSQVLVAKNGIVVYYQNFGYKTYEQLDAIQDKYLYDLASLTKVMATTQAIMLLTERGMLDLDKPIAHYLPQMWYTDKAFIPVREILAHQAGLYPYIPFWKQVLPKRDLEAALTHKKSKGAYQIGNKTYIAPYLQDSLFSWSIHSKRIRKPNAEQAFGYRYSDIGFIILKTLVERIINQPFDDFLDQNLYAPLGMNQTTFTPLTKFMVDDIVPTEGNGKFRMGELTGYVNDQNAALIGGVSGHAGLFSNALDLAKLMQLQLQLGSYGGSTYLYPETILNFTKRQYVGNRRGLGWDKPSKGAHGPTADLASQKTFGHTGFTGTAAWADPEHQLIFIFLSNRVYPDAENFKLIELNIRTRVQRLIYEAIDFNN